jgi:hypothetical protein
VDFGPLEEVGLVTGLSYFGYFGRFANYLELEGLENFESWDRYYGIE